VRDTLLGLEPQDYDVATAARPEAVRALFRGSRYVGEAVGVVLVRWGGRGVEVATFRTEWGYEDGRRPTRVEFTDAEHDARRRDFTVNGLFEDPLLPDTDPRRRVIDYVGGREDLERRVLRAIGEPEERFAEDYLRMLRAVRFTARLGFTLDPATADAIRRHAGSLGRISRERIGLEVAAMLSPPRRAKQRAAAAALAQELGLDAPALGEGHADTPLPTLEGLADRASYPAALAAWILDRQMQRRPAETPQRLGELATALERFIAEDLDGVLKRWRAALALSNENRDALQAAITLLPRLLRWAELGIAPRKRALASPAWPEAFDLLRGLAHEPGVAEWVERIERDAGPLRSEGVAPPPWITGEDLIALGRNPGPDFRRWLKQAYDAQLDGTLRSREEALEWLRSQA
jgi:poly(A) polymerase